MFATTIQHNKSAAFAAGVLKPSQQSDSMCFIRRLDGAVNPHLAIRVASVDRHVISEKNLPWTIVAALLSTTGTGSDTA